MIEIGALRSYLLSMVGRGLAEEEVATELLEHLDDGGMDKLIMELSDRIKLYNEVKDLLQNG